MLYNFMNKLLLLFALFLFSCTKADFTTGIDCTVYFGKGDCMPVFNNATENYKKYNGRIYLVNKEAADSLGKPGFTLLKLKSTSLNIRNGRLSVELPAGTFLVMPEDYYINTTSNTVTIAEKQIYDKDVKIWICTSY